MFGAEQNEDHHEEATPQSKNRNPIIWMGAAVVLMAIAGLVALASNHHQQSTVNQLTARESQMNAQIGTLQSQLAAETEKLNEMTAAQAALEADAVPPRCATEAARRCHERDKPDAFRSRRQYQLNPRRTQRLNCQES